MSRTKSVVLAAVCVALGAHLHAAQHIVVQKNKMFSVAALTVKVGDVVVFKNSDVITHSAFSRTKGLEFNTKAQPPGTATDIVMKGEGTVEVNCAFHPKMKLIITVTK
jgi:plastocyanin